jgi:hypothetical protein
MIDGKKLAMATSRYEWGTVVLYHLDQGVAPFQIWNELVWPEVAPGLPVLLAGHGPNWYERELEKHCTPSASWVAQIKPPLGAATENVLRRVAAEVGAARVRAVLAGDSVPGRTPEVAE